MMQVLAFFTLCWLSLNRPTKGDISRYLPFTVPPKTVDSIDTEQYLGRWYQMYASLVPNSTFERNGYCITADYYESEKKDAAFAVSNNQRVGNVTGELKGVEGDAYATKDPGKFKLKFDNMKQVGDYWITAVGEASNDTNNLYPWAIVSTPYRTSLYILARDIDQFRTDYEEEVLRIAKEQGFTNPFNAPRETYQESDCQYAPIPGGSESSNDNTSSKNDDVSINDRDTKLKVAPSQVDEAASLQYYSDSKERKKQLLRQLRSRQRHAQHRHD